MRIRFFKGLHRPPAKAAGRVKQHLQHAMQRVDTASSKNSGERHDMYPVYEAQMNTGL
jgi:hypothetical protein